MILLVENDPSYTNDLRAMLQAFFSGEKITGVSPNQVAEYNREHDLFYLCGHLHRSPDATTFHAWSGFPETYLPCLTLQTDERANFEGTGFGEMVEVYADRVVFRVRNFCTGEWAQLNGAPHEAVFTLKNPIPTD